MVQSPFFKRCEMCNKLMFIAKYRMTDVDQMTLEPKSYWRYYCKPCMLKLFGKDGLGEIDNKK